MTTQQTNQVNAIAALPNNKALVRSLCVLADIDSLLGLGFITQSQASRARRVLHRTE